MAALHACGALPLASPVPGQLAALCTRMGNPGHVITAPPATDLPEPWQHMLTHPGRQLQAGPARGIAVAAIAELPKLVGTPWIDMVATGRSAEIRIKLPAPLDVKPLQQSLPGSPCRISWTAS